MHLRGAAAYAPLHAELHAVAAGDGTAGGVAVALAGADGRAHHVVVVAVGDDEPAAFDDAGRRVLAPDRHAVVRQELLDQRPHLLRRVRQHNPRAVAELLDLHGVDVAADEHLRARRFARVVLRRRGVRHVGNRPAIDDAHVREFRRHVQLGADFRRQVVVAPIHEDALVVGQIAATVQRKQQRQDADGAQHSAIRVTHPHRLQHPRIPPALKAGRDRPSARALRPAHRR